MSIHDVTNRETEQGVLKTAGGQSGTYKRPRYLLALIFDDNEVDLKNNGVMTEQWVFITDCGIRKSSQ